MRTLLLSVVLASLLIWFSGCSTLAAQAIQPEDAASSLAAAKAQGDADAVACYSAIVRHLDTAPDAAPVPVGVLSEFQHLRYLRRAAAAGIPKDVHRACAVLVLDAQGTLLKLGVRLAPIPGR